MSDTNESSHIYRGSCLCGKVSYQIEGLFEQFFLCHCSRCKKDTGSAHGANLFSNSAKLKWICGQKEIKSFKLEGTRHTKAFCITCGSALPYMIGEQMIVTPAGGLDDKIDMKATAHIFCQNKAGWEEGLNKIMEFEQLPH